MRREAHGSILGKAERRGVDAVSASGFQRLLSNLEGSPCCRRGDREALDVVGGFDRGRVRLVLQLHAGDEPRASLRGRHDDQEPDKGRLPASRTAAKSRGPYLTWWGPAGGTGRQDAHPPGIGTSGAQPEGAGTDGRGSLVGQSANAHLGP